MYDKTIMLPDFETIRTEGESLYRSIGSIRCPYLQTEVYFNARGLEHLKFKRHGKVRPQYDQYMRFKLLRFAPEILKMSRTLQGFRKTQHFERIRKHSRTETVLTPVTYHEFIAVTGNFRCKVVVKQIENGEKFFWSIIPFWGMNKERRERKLYSGDPETD